MKILELIKIIVPILSSVISLIGSYLISKHTTDREFKKLISQQNHEIKMNAFNAYSKLNSAVNAYLSTPILKLQREAVSAVGEFIPYVPGNLLPICHALTDSLKNGKTTNVSDFLLRLNLEWSSAHPKEENNK